MEHDMVIVGAGVAGLNAALYATRYKMKIVVIGMEPGGTGNEAAKIDNWIGSPGKTGTGLMQDFIDHVKSYDVQILEKMVVETKKEGDVFKVKTDDGEEYVGKTLLLATGLKRRKLDVEGVDKYEGKGVSYCFTCDAPLFRDAKVGVVGGNDSAAQAALLLSKYASKVYVIYRKEPMRCEPTLLEKIEKNEKIEMVYNANVTKALGEGTLERVELDNGSTLEVEGLFIEIGSVPSAVFIKKLGVEVNEKDYIKINRECETNVEGVYAAGDVTDGPLKQLITAAAEGAISAFMAYKKTKN